MSSDLSVRLSKNRFLVIGRVGLDLYADPPGTEIENAIGFHAALGGSAANIAVAITRQGGQTALLTAVSNDAVGRYTTKALANYGVDTRFVKRVGGEARNSLAIVETRAENCQSVIYRNDAADFHVTEADAEAIDYAQYAAVIVTGTTLAREPSRSATIKALQLARHAGLVVIIDIDYRPYSWTSKAEAQQVCLKAAEMCDIIVANDEEFAVLAGLHSGLELAENLTQKTGRIVVYKMGDKGCITFSEGTRFDTPIFSQVLLKVWTCRKLFAGGRPQQPSW
jgi:5-dehydro-2-deoxygluconokinase